MANYIGSVDLSNQTPIDGNQTNDTIIGSNGDDIIIAGPATTQTWDPTTAFIDGHGTLHDDPTTNDDQTVIPDNDTIMEASGNNTLTGGYGNDMFKFDINFNVVDHPQTDIFTAPTQVSGANTNGVWHSWLDSLGAWRAAEALAHGTDENTAVTTTTDYTYATKNGTQTGSVTYDNTFTYNNEVATTNTSTNTITDFGNGVDTIQLTGVTADQFAEYGHVGVIGSDTVISIGTFSITLQGITDFTSDHLAFV